MQQLYVVAISDDGEHLLLASSADATEPSHRLPVDSRLQSALRGDLLGASSRGAQSALSPREIQAALRAGQSPQEVADQAGVALVKVLRYAGPVLSERERVIDAARAATMTRHGVGPSTLPLGAAVDRHLADTPDLDAKSVSWHAKRRDDGRWLVELSFATPGQERTVAWTWDPSGRSVAPQDAIAAHFGHVPASGPPGYTGLGGVGRSASGAPAGSPAQAGAQAGAPASAGAPAAPAQTGGTAPVAAPDPAAPVGGERPAAQVAPDPAAPPPASTGAGSSADAPAASAEATSSTARDEAEAQEPLPLRTGEQPAKRSGRRGKRRSVPSWSDVLLGVKPSEANDEADSNASAPDQRAN